MRTIVALLLAVLALAGAAVGISKVGTAATSGNGLQVVAAENFWGSVASQLGGNRAHVTSVITSPATDPHDYEPTAADARTIAGAQMVIVNGIGYDPWAGKLIAANPVHGRAVLTVGNLLAIKPGGNPHRWYSPSDVQNESVHALYSNITLAATQRCQYCMASENNLPVYVLSSPTSSVFPQLWDSLKHYD